VLSGVTYLLLTNPDKLARLTDEVRNAFQSDADITIAKASQLVYMLACLDETMRLYPPVPIGLPRVVPNGGGIIGGCYVPENVRVTFSYHLMAIWASHFGPSSWTHAKNTDPRFHMAPGSIPQSGLLRRPCKLLP
jgi:cytochrome P450